MKIVVPMAGRGKRFSDSSEVNNEYLLPKPMIRVLNKSMIEWAMDSYNSFLQQDENDNNKPVKFKDLFFICLKEHDDQFEISDFLKNIFSDEINILFTKRVTNGPAETAMLAENYINSEEDVIISDCDHHFDGRELWRLIVKGHPEPNFLGILPVIKPNDTEPSWSYVVLNDKNEVIDIREKDATLASGGAYGVIGAYYFKHGRDFVAEARKMIKENDRVGNVLKMEFYLSRVYQRMIKKGYLVKSAFIKSGSVLGTPQHLQKFIEYKKFKDPG